MTSVGSAFSQCGGASTATLSASEVSAYAQSPTATESTTAAVAAATTKVCEAAAALAALGNQTAPADCASTPPSSKKRITKQGHEQLAKSGLDPLVSLSTLLHYYYHH